MPPLYARLFGSSRKYDSAVRLLHKRISACILLQCSSSSFSNNTVLVSSVRRGMMNDIALWARMLFLCVCMRECERGLWEGVSMWAASKIHCCFFHIYGVQQKFCLTEKIAMHQGFISPLSVYVCVCFCLYRRASSCIYVFYVFFSQKCEPPS